VGIEVVAARMLKKHTLTVGVRPCALVGHKCSNLTGADLVILFEPDQLALAPVRLMVMVAGLAPGIGV
jgi:hypothetical protein